MYHCVSIAIKPGEDIVASFAVQNGLSEWRRIFEYAERNEFQ